MSIRMGATRIIEGAQDADLNSTGTTLNVIAAKPMDLVRFGFIVTSGTATGTDLNLQLAHRDPPGTGSFTIIAELSPDETVEQGDGLFMTLANTNTTDSDGVSTPDGQFLVNAGGEVRLIVDAGAASGAEGMLCLEFYEHPFVHTSSDSDEDRLDGMTIVDQE